MGVIGTTPIEAVEDELTLAALIGVVKPREASAVALYYGIKCQPLTFVELGRLFGVSTERARQIVCRGVKKMSRAMREFDQSSGVNTFPIRRLPEWARLLF